MIAMLEKNKRYKLIEKSDDQQPVATKKGKYSLYRRIIKRVYEASYNH